jgi:predicted ester cyclase
MSIEDNRTAVRKLCAMLDSHNLDDLSEVMEEDFVEQVPAPGQGPGLEGFRRYMEYMYTAFPDLRWHVVDQVAEDDKVATLHIWEGHTAAPTRGSTPPTSTFVWPR